MSDAAEAKLMSQAHMRWMVATLQSEGGKCTYEKLVEVGEEHHCDTVGALLKILKNRKVLKFKGQFLMYPMHKDTMVKIKDAEKWRDMEFLEAEKVADEDSSSSSASGSESS